MPIGDSTPTAEFVGDEEVSRRYLGDDLVWEAELSPQRPNELYWDFTDTVGVPITVPQTANSGIFADSGQQMNCINVGEDGSIGLSSLGDKIVYNHAPVGSSYLSPEDPMDNLGYIASQHRFNTTGKTSTLGSYGVIGWTQRSNILTVDSSCHLVITPDTGPNGRVFIQEVVNGVPQSAFVSWDVDLHSIGEATQFLEYAILPDIGDGVTGAIIVRLPDNRVVSHESTLFHDMVITIPCWEPFYSGGYDGDEWSPEVEKIWAASLNHIHMNERQEFYYNLLLAEGGYGPLYVPPPSIDFIGAVAIQGTTLDISSLGHQADDLLVFFAYNQDSNTIPVLQSGWEDWPGGLTNSGGTNALRVATRVATGNETSITWPGVTQPIVLCFRKAAPGAEALTTGNGSQVSFASIPAFENTDGTSKALLIYGHRNQSGSSGEEPGYTMVATTVSATTAKSTAYLSDNPLSAYAGGDVPNGSSGPWISVSLELRLVT